MMPVSLQWILPSSRMYQC